MRSGFIRSLVLFYYHHILNNRYSFSLPLQLILYQLVSLLEFFLSHHEETDTKIESKIEYLLRGWRGRKKEWMCLSPFLIRAYRHSIQDVICLNIHTTFADYNHLFKRQVREKWCDVLHKKCSWTQNNNLTPYFTNLIMMKSRELEQVNGSSYLLEAVLSKKFK